MSRPSSIVGHPICRGGGTGQRSRLEAISSRCDAGGAQWLLAMRHDYAGERRRSGGRLWRIPRVGYLDPGALEVAHVPGGEDSVVNGADRGDLGIANPDWASGAFAGGDNEAVRVGARGVEGEYQTIEIICHEPVDRFTECCSALTLGESRDAEAKLPQARRCDRQFDLGIHPPNDRRIWGRLGEL